MTNHRKASTIAFLALALSAVGPISLPQSAHAKTCGGLKEKACPKILPGPQCKKGLKVVDKICLPDGKPDKPGKLKCGGLKEKACPKILPGPQCKKGLKVVGEICLPNGKPDKPGKPKCGGLKQKACPKIWPGPQCKPGLKVVRGICLPAGRPDKPERPKCGGLKQPACPPSLPGPECRNGLVNVIGICIRKRESGDPEALKCGGFMRPGCPKKVRVPACDAGLRLNPLNKLCVKASEPSSVVATAKRCLEDFKPMGMAMLKYRACQVGLGKLEALKRAIKAKKLEDIRGIVEAARCKGELDNMISVLRAEGFRAFSMGVSGEGSAGFGLSSEFYVAMNLDLSDATTYQQVGGSLGVSAGIGLNGVVSAFYNKADDLSGGGKSFSAGGKFLLGGSAAVGLSSGKSPRCESFSAAGGKGVGANFGSIALTHTHKLFRFPKIDTSPGCKDVRIVGKNKTGKKIKVVDIDFYDYQKNGWRSKNTWNKKLENGETFDRKYRLQKVGGDATKVKIQYKVHEGGWKWSRMLSSSSSKRTCRDGMVFNIDIGGPRNQSCGGSGQRACPKEMPGPECKPGLKKTRMGMYYMCVPN